MNFGQIKIGIRVKENRKFRDKLFFFPPPMLLPPDAPFVGKPIKQEDERGLKYFQYSYDPKRKHSHSGERKTHPYLIRTVETGIL